MTSIYHQSKEAAAEARLARLDDLPDDYITICDHGKMRRMYSPNAAAYKAEYERVVAGSSGAESAIKTLENARIIMISLEEIRHTFNPCGSFVITPPLYDIQFPKSTHSSKEDDKG